MSKNEVVTVDQTSNMVASLSIGGNFKIAGTKKVTRDVLAQENDKPFGVIIISPMRKGEAIESEVAAEGSGPTEKKKGQPYVAVVTDLSDGVEKILVCNAALRSALLQNYPDATYVGKAFGIVSRLEKHPQGGGKTLRRYYIEELILEAA